MHTHLEQWAADAAVPGEQLEVRCLAQGSHLSRGQFLPEPRFEPTTLDYKSNALSTRPKTAPEYDILHILRAQFTSVINSSFHTSLNRFLPLMANFTIFVFKSVNFEFNFNI